MINRVILIGRLTRDPELKYTSTGYPVASFTLAVDRGFTNKQGEREADFIPVVVWNKLAENCSKYLAKGHLVGVEGKLQVRSYEAKDGGRRYVTEVIADMVQFLEKKSSEAGKQVEQYDDGLLDPFGEEENEVNFDEVPF